MKAWKIENGIHAFYLLVGETYLYKFADVTIKTAFQEKGFEIITPPQEASTRSVMAKHVDNHVIRYEEEEIKASIENQNDWAKVEEVRKISTKEGPIIVKIRFQQASMAQKALTSGFTMLSQSLPAWAIEEETYVPINPCSNCYSYHHFRKNCPRPQITLCSKCSMTGHKRFSCTNNVKCIHCHEAHATFHPQCKEKKKYLREEGAKIREKKKNQNNRATPFQSYANSAATGVRPNNQNNQGNCSCNFQRFPPIDPTISTKILSGITYAHFMDNQEPGSFQEIMDEFCTLNNLPIVIFPRRTNKNNPAQSASSLSGPNTPNEEGNTTNPNSVIENTQINNNSHSDLTLGMTSVEATEGDAGGIQPTITNTPSHNNTFVAPAASVMDTECGEAAEASSGGTKPKKSNTTQDNNAFVAPSTPSTPSSNIPPSSSQDERSRKPHRDGSKTRRTIRSSSRKLRHSSANKKKSLKDHKLSLYYPKSWKEDGKRTDDAMLVDLFLDGALPFNHDSTISYYKLKEKVHDLAVKKALLPDAIQFCEIPDENYNALRNNMSILEKEKRQAAANSNN